METLYRKVAISERLPNEGYTVFILNEKDEWQANGYFDRGEWFSDFDNEYPCFPTHWLEEINITEISNWGIGTKESKELLNEVDDLLVRLEDYTHGEDGRDVTKIRNKISLFMKSDYTEVIPKLESEKAEIFPKYFLTKAGHHVKKHKTEKSGDGTPRYVVNPNSPDNTYSIKGCISSGFKPIY